VTHHSISRRQGGGDGPPTGGYSSPQQLVSVRKMIPDGDRRDSPQSGRSIHQDPPVAPRYDNVVGKLVLYDYICDYLRMHGPLRLRTGPPDNILQTAMTAQFPFYLGQIAVRQICVI
jgi:hypothetical protein